MHVYIHLVWLVGLWFSSTINAAAISNADITIAKRTIQSESEMIVGARDVPFALAKRLPKAAPVTKAAASLNAPNVLFKRDCKVFECDWGMGGPGDQTFGTLVRLFREQFDNGNFKIANNQDYCVSCSGGMLGFAWDADYVFTSNTAMFEKHMSCIDPWQTGCIISDGDAWPYGAYHYGFVHSSHGGDAKCRKC